MLGLLQGPLALKWWLSREGAPHLRHQSKILKNYLREKDRALPSSCFHLACEGLRANMKEKCQAAATRLDIKNDFLPMKAVLGLKRNPAEPAFT